MLIPFKNIWNEKALQNLSKSTYISCITFKMCGNSTRSKTKLHLLKALIGMLSPSFFEPEAAILRKTMKAQEKDSR